MAALTPDDVATFTGQPTDFDRYESIISVVTSMASAYTRGEGFTAGEPNSDIRAVILAAVARMAANLTGVSAETMGPFSVRYGGGGFNWTVAERYVLDRYRVKAQ